MYGKEGTINEGCVLFLPRQAIVVPLRIEKGMARESYCALTDSSHTIKGLGHLSNEKNKTEIK
jgi:hypothetical protein